MAGEKCNVDNSAYARWSGSGGADGKDIRKEAAEKIVSIIEAWEPGEE
jgi:hypothetical protein